MIKWDWFDDFMIMNMMEEDEAKKAETEKNSGGFVPVHWATEETEVMEEDEEDYESAELLEALQEELSTLQDELLTVECNEPDDSLSEAYTRWEQRRDLLEAQIYDVEVAIQELE